MEMDLLDIVLRILTGALIGFCIGMTGVGGGVILVPTLTLGFGMAPSVSVGTAILYTFLAKISAVYHHVRLKTINYRTAWTFLIGAIPGSAVASWYVNHRAGSVLDEAASIQFQENLKFFIAAAMLASTGLLILNLVQTRINRTPSEPGNRPDRVLLCMLLGAVVGAVVGSTALGAGILAIPVLLFCFRTATSQTVGSSIFIGLMLTLISSFIYGKGGQIHILTAVFMSLGAIPGVYYGSRMTVLLSEEKLKIVVIGLIAVASFLMFFKQ